MISLLIQKRSVLGRFVNFNALNNKSIYIMHA